MSVPNKSSATTLMVMALFVGIQCSESQLHSHVRKVTVNPTYREYSVLSVYMCACVRFIIFSADRIGYVDDLAKETLRRCKEQVIETLNSQQHPWTSKQPV